MRIFTASAMLVLLLAACSSEPPSLTNPDAPAKNGCEHFANVFNDHRNGLLTPPEVAVKYREVYDSLILSEVPELGDKAMELSRQMIRNPWMSAGNSWTLRLLEDCAEVLENS